MSDEFMIKTSDQISCSIFQKGAGAAMGVFKISTRTLNSGMNDFDPECIFNLPLRYQTPSSLITWLHDEVRNSNLE